MPVHSTLRTVVPTVCVLARAGLPHRVQSLVGSEDVPGPEVRTSGSGNPGRQGRPHSIGCAGGAVLALACLSLILSSLGVLLLLLLLSLLLLLLLYCRC